MISKNDTIVTAYCCSASGPGWGNSPIWVIVRDREGKMREECIQPKEQTRDMWVLYGVSQATHLAMKGSVEVWAEKKGRGRQT